MSVLLETTLGDIVIDLDTNRSPILAKNFLKLCKSRYYTQTLAYNVQPFRFCQLGDPTASGKGGSSIFGLIDAATSTTTSSVEKSNKRFIQLHDHPQNTTTTTMELTKQETQKKGIVAIIPEMEG